MAVLGVVALPLRMQGAAAAAGPEPVDDPAALVNPFIGTSGAVNTFPGPDVPFGMMQWGPDTTPDRAQGGGYEYDSSELSGFSLAHVSGPGCDVAGDVPILPVAGDLPAKPSDASVGFSHDDERAEIGSYRVTDAAGVTTELSDTARAGLGRFTFPAGKQANLLLKLTGGATPVDGTRVRVVNDHEVTGSVDSGHFCGADNTYTLHFDITFDRPFAKSGTWSGDTIHRDATSLESDRAGQPHPSHPAGARHTRHFTVPGKPAPVVHGEQPAGTSGRGTTATPRATQATDGAKGMYLTFDTGTDRSVTAAVGISYTSDAGAAANRTAEIKGWNPDTLRRASHHAWNRVLGRIRVGGGSHDDQVQFYTALYHALLHPNVFSDVDGRYMGMDDKVHRLAKGQRAQYANYSGWDTYRSQTQLMAMVAPRVTGDIVTSMLNGYDQTGVLPKWASNNGESYVMVGDPGTAIIADAHAFGVRGFDTAHALEAMVHQATVPNKDRPGEEVRERKGYLPLDGEYGCCNFYGPVSTQLEYDSADYALASFAKSLGRKDLYEKFASRAQDWQNVFNPQSGYLQARNADGSFAGGFTPGTSTGFVEGTSAQYTPMVPFNLKELITARGGTDAYDSYLDGLLDHITDPSGTDANLSNEPSVEIPWEYSYLGRPWKTQAAVRQAQQKLYFNAPVGSFGNDDLGAMSSWYVWSMLGAYPETPGTDTLVLGSPAFPLAQVTFADGHRLTVHAPKAAPDAPYVQSLTVGHRQWNESWLTFDDFRTAGTMDFTLGTEPNTAWASSADAVPPSDTTGGGKLLAATGPGNGLVMAPGGSGKGSLNLTNLGAEPVTVDWTAKAPSGVHVEPSSGSIDVPAAGRAQTKVEVAAGDKEGAYPVTFALADHAGGADLGTASLRVAVAKPGELWPYETNKAEYPDGTTFTGGFDGGGWAYSKDALAAAGVTSGSKVTADGITYTWPTMAEDRPDNLTMAGQTIPEPDGTKGSALGLLGAAVNAGKDGVPGTLTVTYTDGGTTKADVTFSDWTLVGGTGEPAEGNTKAVTTAYRNTAGGGRDTVNAYVFAVRVPLDPDRTVASVTMPVTGSSGSVHVFALTFAE